MSKTVLLVDYESVQKVDFGRLARDTSVLFVFGAKYTRNPAELLLRQQELRERFRIIAIREVQTNAADFCIAYYLGEQLTREPHTRCVILSKDKKAFDPLIRHLVSERKLSVTRANSFDEGLPEAAWARKDILSLARGLSPSPRAARGGHAAAEDARSAREEIQIMAAERRPGGTRGRSGSVVLGSQGR